MIDLDEIIRDELAELEASERFQAAPKQQQRWEKRYDELSAYVLALASKKPEQRHWVQGRIREEVGRHYQTEWRRTERKSKKSAQDKFPENLESQVARVMAMLDQIGAMLDFDSEGYHKSTKEFSDNVLALASPFPELIARAQFLDAEGSSVLEKRAWFAIDFSVRWFDARGQWPRKKDVRDVLTDEHPEYFPAGLGLNTWTQVFHKAGLFDVLRHGAGGSRYRGSE